MYHKNDDHSGIERYLEYLHEIFQVEPLFFMCESEIEGLPGVTSIVFENIPEKGMVTGVTYGLSLVQHPDWKYGRPELMISVESKDLAWGQVVGFVANRLRGDCPFSYSNTINFREQIAKESEMDAFLVFAPSILERPDFLDIDIGMDYKIHLAGLYPIYSSEIGFVHNWGLERFWHHPDFAMYDVNRKRIEK